MIAASRWITTAAREPVPGRYSAGRNSFHIALIAALLCFLWQTIVLQAHFHSPLTTAAVGANATAQISVHSDDPDSDDPAHCPICQERVHAGAYLTPEPIVFDPPQSIGVRVDALQTLRGAAASRSHAWQSRAPPLHLQA